MALTPSTPVALQAALRSDPWFAGCAPALQAALLGLGRMARLPSGTRLFARGDEAAGLCCVTAGALRVGALQADGSESLLAWVEPYQWFGEISLLDGLPRTHDAVADGDSTVLIVPQPALLAWLDAHPACWRDLGRLACTKLRTTFTVLEDIAHLPLEPRLAKRLWQVAHAYGARPDAPRRHIRLPQEQLALMLGVSRQTANKALRALEAQGVLKLRYGAIEVVDLPRLAGVAGLG
ncbi:MAG: Crp/Fnr family transcriptional regulator [Rhizobacter sp.]|nr:Crp/Fnr family transcriptional regulator [Rhizobacter sp.]